jgi:acyl carrier protein
MVCKEEFSHEELRAYLSAQLPDYMVPSYFVEMESLPLNGNGKVNRKALPAPEVKAGDDYVAPSNKTEEQLVKIWSEVLNIPQEEISVTANFFSIGGNSLIVLRLHNIINQNFDVQLNIVDYFNHNYIKVFADLIISLQRQNEDDMNTINNDKHNILKF